MYSVSDNEDFLEKVYIKIFESTLYSEGVAPVAPFTNMD